MYGAFWKIASSAGSMSGGRKGMTQCWLLTLLVLWMLESGSTGWQQHTWVGSLRAVVCLSGSVLLAVGEGKGILRLGSGVTPS